MKTMRSVAEKGYGHYLILKILKAIFYPVHMLLWIVYAFILSVLGVSIELLSSIKDYLRVAKREFSSKFLSGSRHFKNFSRKDYSKIYYKSVALQPKDIAR